MAEGTEGQTSPFKDRDPAPTFDGSVEKFKGWLRELTLWKHDTDVPKVKHGTKVYRQLSGAAKSAVDEIQVDEIVKETGLDKIIAKLKEHFEPYLETAVPKAFEKAIYGEPRRAKEAFGEFVIRADAAFRELKDEGIELDTKVTGYVIYRQANLSQVQEDQVATWISGQYDRGSVVGALRKLEKVQKEKGGRSYLVDDEDTEKDVMYGGNEWGDEWDAADDEGYVFLGEGELNEIYEEEELMEALATYQEVRKAIRDQKNSRGYYPTKGKGKGKSKGRGEGRGRHVHVEMLKLRTRCAKCGKVGHWARECRGEMDEVAKNKARLASSSGSPSSAAPSGFFQVSTEPPDDETHFGCEVTLGSIINQKAKQIEIEEFTGITMQSHQGVVDTAAQGGLIGKRALENLQGELKRHGLKVNPLQKTGKARGIGGQASVCGMAEVPLGIAGINGVLEVTVVEESVPLLIPISLLTALESIIDLHDMKIEFPRLEAEAPLHRLPTGHVAVDVCDFHQGKWKLPREALQHGRVEEMYRECKKVGFSWHGWTAEAMIAENLMVLGSSCRSVSRHDAPQPHHQDEPRRAGGAQGAPGAQREASNSKLARAFTGSLRPGGTRQQVGKWSGSRATRWILAWLIFVYLPSRKAR